MNLNELLFPLLVVSLLSVFFIGLTKVNISSEFTPLIEVKEGSFLDTEDLLGIDEYNRLDSIYNDIYPCSQNGMMMYPVFYNDVPEIWESRDFFRYDGNGGRMKAFYSHTNPDSAVIKLANFLKRELPCK